MWTKIILEILVGGGIGWRRNRLPISVFSGFPYSSVGKESAYNAGDLGLIPGLGRSPGEDNRKATHSSILAWTVPRTESLAGHSPQGRKELDTTERLSNSWTQLNEISITSDTQMTPPLWQKAKKN